MKRSRRILSKQQAQFYTKSYPHESGDPKEAPIGLFAKDRQRLDETRKLEDGNESDRREATSTDTNTGR